MPHDPKRTRFLYGILFAWVPCLPFFVYIARDVMAAAGSNKATDFGAVAALILLSRSFARGHWLRSMVAAVSMLWSSTVLCLLGLLVWVLHIHR